MKTPGWQELYKLYRGVPKYQSSTRLRVPAVSWIKHVGGRTLQFCDRRLQISDRGDMGAQNFNFAPKFPRNVNCQP